MIHYEVNEQTYSDTESGDYLAYGVTLCRGHTVVREIGDITLDKALAEALVRTFNAEKLSPAHLDEAIESFLMDFDPTF